MSHLLRRPAAVPALFSAGIEDAAALRRRAVSGQVLADASGFVILPFLVFQAELPLVRGAAELLRLALPH